MSNRIRKLSNKVALARKFAETLARHEAMLQALDKYIEGIEALLVNKGVIDRNELESLAEKVTAGPQTADPYEGLPR